MLELQMGTFYHMGLQALGFFGFHAPVLNANSSLVLMGISCNYLYFN